jgi:hypothetical protein
MQNLRKSAWPCILEAIEHAKVISTAAAPKNSIFSAMIQTYFSGFFLLDRYYSTGSTSRSSAL